jgi:hypothetical protein
VSSSPILASGGGSLASSLSSSSAGAAPIVPSNRRLKIWYEIVDQATGAVLEHAWQKYLPFPTSISPSLPLSLSLSFFVCMYVCVCGPTMVARRGGYRTIGSGEQLVIKAEPSWFGTVVSVADQVQSLLKRNGRFSSRLLADAYRYVSSSASFMFVHTPNTWQVRSSSPIPRWMSRLVELNRSFHRLVGPEATELGCGVGFSRPGLGSGGGDVGSWSLVFWVYLLREHTGHMRLLLLRGLDSDQSRQVRHSVLLVCIMVNGPLALASHSGVVRGLVCEHAHDHNLLYLHLSTQAVMMGSEDRRVVVTVSTENDWRESFASNSEVPLAEWTHVLVRCDARQRSVSILINGLPDGEHRLSSLTKPNPHPFYIGHPPEGVIRVPLSPHSFAPHRES